MPHNVIQSIEKQRKSGNAVKMRELLGDFLMEDKEVDELFDQSTSRPRERVGSSFFNVFVNIDVLSMLMSLSVSVSKMRILIKV